MVHQSPTMYIGMGMYQTKHPRARPEPKPAPHRIRWSRHQVFFSFKRSPAAYDYSHSIACPEPWQLAALSPSHCPAGVPCPVCAAGLRSRCYTSDGVYRTSWPADKRSVQQDIHGWLSRLSHPYHLVDLLRDAKERERERFLALKADLKSKWR